MARNTSGDNNKGLSFPAQIASNLIADTVLMTGRADLTDFAEEVRGLGFARKASLISFQSALTVLMNKTALPQPAKVIAEDVIDKVFLGLRSLPPGASSGAILQALETGGQAALSYVQAKLGKRRTPEHQESQFPKHEAGLTADESRALLAWDRTLRTAPNEDLSNWEWYRDRKIDSVDRLRKLLLQDASDRLPYLVCVFGRKEDEKPLTASLGGVIGFLSAAKDHIGGRTSETWKTFEKKIAESDEAIVKFGNEQEAEADRIRERNEMPLWLSATGYILLGAALLTGFVALCIKVF